MASIPRLSGPRVFPQPASSDRINPRAPIEAFGGNNPVYGEAAALGQDLTGRYVREGDLEQRAIEKARHNANQVASAEFAAKFTAEEIRVRNQLAQVRGKEAARASTEAMKSYGKFYEEQVKSIADPDLKERARGHFLTNRNSLNGYAEGHAARELSQWDTETNEALVDNEMLAGTNAWNEPERVEIATARIAGAYEAMAARNGKPPGWAEAESGKAISAMNTAVVNKMLAAGKVEEARDFYTNRPGAFRDAAAVERALQQQTELGDIQAAVDQVMMGDPTTMGMAGIAGGPVVTPAQTRDEALARIDRMAEGKEPKWREQARDLLKERWADMEQDRERETESIYESMTKKYDSDPSQDPRQVDPVGWQKLPTKYRDALLKRYAKEQTNDGVFLDFMSKSLDEVAGYSRARFESEVWSKLPEKQRNEAQTRWTRAIDAGNKPDKAAAFSGIISDEQMIFKAAQEFGIGGIGKDDTLESIRKDEAKNDKKKAALLEWRESLNAAMQAYHSASGKNADDTVKKELIYNLVEKKFLGTDQPTYRVTPADEFSKSLSVPYDSIAPVDRAVIENRIKRDGGIVTQDKVSRIYAAFKMGNKALAQAIISE